MSILITWSTHDGYEIRDVHSKWHERVHQFMLDKYYKPHALYAISGMQEDEAVSEDFKQHLWHLLKGECCILAVNDECNEIEAVAIVKWMSRKWRSWTMLEILAHSSQWREIVTLQRRLLDAYAKSAPPDHPYDSMHLFEYYVSDKLRADAEFMAKFFSAICELARHMKMPRVTFAALSIAEQSDIAAAGFTELVRFMYSMYKNLEGMRPFTIWRDLNEMFVALYEREVAPLVPYKEMRGFEELEERERLAQLRREQV